MMRKAIEADRKLFKEFDAALGVVCTSIELSSEGKRAREDAMRKELKQRHDGNVKDALAAVDAMEQAERVPMDLTDPAFASAREFISVLGDDVQTAMLREVAHGMQGNQRNLAAFEAVAKSCGVSDVKIDLALAEYVYPSDTFAMMRDAVKDAGSRNAAIGLEVEGLLEAVETSVEEKDPLAPKRKGSLVMVL